MPHTALVAPYSSSMIPCLSDSLFVAVTLILGATEHWTAFGLTVLGFLVAGSVISRRNSPSKLQRPLISQLAIISLGVAAFSGLVLDCSAFPGSIRHRVLCSFWFRFLRTKLISLRAIEIAARLTFNWE